MKSLTRIFVALLLVVGITFGGFHSNANAATPENAFAGTWVGGNETIVITESKNIITSVTFSNGRKGFLGFEVDLYAPVISVNFTDDAPFTGVLAGNRILWSNGTTWIRR
ncbi:MAG: hypothetical protein ACFKPT_01695 [Gloeotrichia echinulata GP01]